MLAKTPVSLRNFLRTEHCLREQARSHTLRIAAKFKESCRLSFPCRTPSIQNRSIPTAHHFLRVRVHQHFGLGEFVLNRCFHLLA